MTQEMIETFLTILKYRNITAAARQLYTSQSTVSHRLQLLEDEVGMQLFVRQKGHRAIEITPEGEDFIPIAQRWMSVFRDTDRLKDNLHRKTLAIGGVDLVNSFTFIPLYQEFIEQHPDISMQIQTHHSRELYALIENRELDISYVYSQRRYPDILSKLIYQENMYLICHKSSPYYDGIRPEELSADHEVFLKWSSNYGLWHDRYWPNRTSLLSVGTGLQLSQFLTMDDRRWAIAPCSVYESLGNPDLFARYELSDPPPALTCYELTHRYPKHSSTELLKMFQGSVSTYVCESSFLNDKA
jgi:DNA-binding transcriptional LysR family regulator